MNIFIFDVDGTLTPSRQSIPAEEKDFFLNFCQRNEVYLVTGSDRPKTIEQLGKEIYDAAQKVFNCSGNDIWVKDHNIYRSDWTLPEEARKWLEKKLKKSPFVLRTGQHIEDRPGSVNFSVVGRGATLAERKLYVEYDHQTDERKKIAVEFNHTFYDLQARIGGETGLDIFAKHADKSQILLDGHLPSTDRNQIQIYFFGDKAEPGGNDYPIAGLIEKHSLGKVFKIKNHLDTFNTLRKLQKEEIAR